MAGANRGPSIQTALTGKKSGIWQRIVIALAGLLLLIGGVFFDTFIDFDFDNFDRWGGFSGVGVVLIIPGLLFGALAAFLPRGKLNVLFVVSIPVAVVSAIALALLGTVTIVCACD